MKYWIQRQIGKVLYALGRPLTYSMSIADEVTAGYGELDCNGFWQYPAPFNVTEHLDEMPCPCESAGVMSCQDCQDLLPQGDGD